MSLKTAKFSKKQIANDNLTDVETTSKDHITSQSVSSGYVLDSKPAIYSSQQSVSHNKSVDYEQTPLYRAFSPLMFSLKLVGMYHTRNKNNDGKFCATPTFSQIYSWFLTMITWTLTVRVAVTLRLTNGPGVMMLDALSFLAWYSLCALNATCFLKASHNPESIKEYFLGFIKLKKFGGPFVCPITTRKYVFIGSIVTWIVVFVNITVFGYLINATQMFDVFATDPFQPIDTAGYLALKIVFTILNFFMSAFWLFPSTMQLSVCLIIYQELKLFCTSLGSKATEDGDFTGQSLEPERRHFLQIVNIIESADNCLSLHQSAAFACNVINICLILYIFITYPTSVPAAVGAMVF